MRMRNTAPGLATSTAGASTLRTEIKRHINHDEADWFRKVMRAEFAGVALDGNNASVLCELPVELIDVHVQGVDAGGSVLEQAIGEPAIGSADVQASATGRVNRKVFEGAFELCSTST